MGHLLPDVPQLNRTKQETDNGGRSPPSRARKSARPVGDV